MDIFIFPPNSLDRQRHFSCPTNKCHTFLQEFNNLLAEGKIHFSPDKIYILLLRPSNAVSCSTFTANLCSNLLFEFLPPCYSISWPVMLSPDLFGMFLCPLLQVPIWMSLVCKDIQNMQCCQYASCLPTTAF